MNRNYFAKYLPVGGEIKEGDKYLWLGELYEASSLSIKSGQAKNPIKLFLCSRDIQVGDTIRAKDNSGEMLITKETRVGVRGELTILTGEKSEGDITWAQLESDWYKILGKISPEATWVKEYDEFTENEIEIVYKKKFECLCGKKDTLSSWWGKSNNCIHETEDNYNHAYTCFREISVINYIKILGPCKHFH